MADMAAKTAAVAAAAATSAASRRACLSGGTGAAEVVIHCAAQSAWSIHPTTPVHAPTHTATRNRNKQTAGRNWHGQ